ncbi:uncharacterized protein TNCV_2813411 [Trichonephila clavipes]|nr:uncharacterized protein TNCV_2813411 [Trichonephila clavipes]
MPRIKKFGRRKYSSNQHKKSKSTEELLLNSVESASRRKIKIPDLLKEQDSQNVNIIVELDLLSSLMKNLLCSKYCCSSEKIELREDLKSRRGLAVSLEIICHNCGESTSTMSSKISNKCYDVNLRLTYGMRAIGKGGAAARIFCGLMNLPPPPAKFERHNSLFLNLLKTISEYSMNAAVHEAVIANDNNSNIAVAVDGTWHKRGYSSLNGVVCVLRLLRTERLSTSKLSQNFVLHVRSHSLSSLRNYLRAFGDGHVAGVSGGQGTESWLACLEFEPSATKDPSCRVAMHVKSIES